MFSINSLLRENIRNLKPYSSARDEFSEVADIYLDANENPYDSSYNRYPDPHQRVLKKKIASLKSVNVEQVFLGNGSDEAIDLLIRAFCEPYKESILITEPTYGMYSVCANIHGVNVKNVLLTKDFELNPTEITEKINDSVKLIFLCSPNNPTGNVLNKESVLQIIQNFNGIVVIDEAYIDFSTDKGFLSYLNQFPNLVILQTFSKAWGLAGIRLGMCFASKEIIDVLTKIKPPYNISGVTQQLALDALQNVDTKEARVHEIIREREKLKTSLEQLSITKKVFPSEANFLLVEFNNAPFIFLNLLKKKIIVRDRTKALLCHDCLRITVGTPEENKILLEALSEL